MYITGVLTLAAYGNIHMQQKRQNTKNISILKFLFSKTSVTFYFIKLQYLYFRKIIIDEFLNYS